MFRVPCPVFVLVLGSVLLTGCVTSGVDETILPPRIDYVCANNRVLPVARGSDGRRAVVLVDGKEVTLQRAGSAAQEKYGNERYSLYLNGERAIPGYYYSSTYDRAWNAALGAVQDAQVTSAEPRSGFIRGTKDGINVTVSVLRQADGRTRVQFDTKGPTERDPGLANRLSEAYEPRMGR